ncbi:MAG TPA: prepilin-type N-terminal cleavage/methylation domain-containing protein [Longimicrobiaceae bacterium]|nr:prepilin-type N-terminal cleavage/methylation domain-containing protein [Longimicrobiaceae bacterium]
MRAADRRGFTLIEAVVALALAGMLVAAALGVAAADVRASRRAASVQEASSLADELIARTDLAPPEQFALWADTADGHFDAPLDRYSWRIAARPVPGEEDLFDVHVQVLWRDGSVAADTRVVPRRTIPLRIGP